MTRDRKRDVAGDWTRRDFLKAGSAAALGGFFLGSPSDVFAGTEKKARVVLIRNETVIGEGGELNRDILGEMLDEAVSALVGAPDASSAWKKLIAASDVVGIKSNEWPPLRTPRELETLLVERVRGVGVPRDAVDVRDRTVRGSKVFSDATALVNARPLRTHHWSGVGSLLKNYIMFTGNPDEYHPDACANLATLWQKPVIAGKTRLNVLVALTPLFHGIGPHHYNPEFVWRYGGLLVGVDPVAVDATGLLVLQAKRRAYFGEERPITPSPKHVLLADTRFGLGTADPAKIELIKLGWTDGALI